jgi:hypothetical protein
LLMNSFGWVGALLDLSLNLKKYSCRFCFLHKLIQFLFYF